MAVLITMVAVNISVAKTKGENCKVTPLAFYLSVNPCARWGVGDGGGCDCSGAVAKKIVFTNRFCSYFFSWHFHPPLFFCLSGVIKTTVCTIARLTFVLPYYMFMCDRGGGRVWRHFLQTCFGQTQKMYNISNEEVLFKLVCSAT